MFDSTIELISLVSSNSHLVFCFCNLLIGILFVSNSKSNSAPSYSEKNMCLTLSPKRIEGDHKHEDDGDAILVDMKTISYAAEGPTPNIAEATANLNVVEAPTTDEEHINTGEDNKNDDEEEDDDDELRRRAEEFIAKINRAWKAEKLGTFSPYVHRDQLHGHLSGALVM
ncbi:hypothetical protein AQUCO_01300595v1 [Aquilegia coerulea]|uniref:Uncharacterized protein n=1 Tax=Aquilegia coerulea TaxID=218851 RepID=A0A2G5E2G9_AQUCA|nr:hypothetical protein AQUCO_01300595v1 [Aquilegia coerulea]